MKRRIALWALVGFAVAFGWALVSVAISPDFGRWNRGPLWLLAEITCPIAVIGKHVPLSVYAVIAINAATYALVGLGVELMRRSTFHATD